MPSKPLNLVGATALGFGLAYFLDPNSGAQRRNVLRDKVASKARGGAAGVVGSARDVGARATGAVAAVTGDEATPPNDEALAAKVKSEVLGDHEVPKDKINIDVSDGIVALRGEVEDRELMQALDAKVREVTGVRAVQNLLHLPGESPPNLS
ncbi:MAG: BON domain-containing protein [Actinomycetota bacterium]|nr:BON domain-containing protein [Actinomycetota bacterium]